MWGFVCFFYLFILSRNWGGWATTVFFMNSRTKGRWLYLSHIVKSVMHIFDTKWLLTFCWLAPRSLLGSPIFSLPYCTPPRLRYLEITSCKHLQCKHQHISSFYFFSWFFFSIFPHIITSKKALLTFSLIHTFQTVKYLIEL